MYKLSNIHNTPYKPHISVLTAFHSKWEHAIPQPRIWLYENSYFANCWLFSKLVIEWPCIIPKASNMKQKFGGNWTEKKLNAFINYVKAYSIILNKVKDKYNWKTIYYDGFAGFGESKNELNNVPGILDCFVTEEELNVYQGSVKRVLELEEKYWFDYYYFVDNNKEYIADLERIKSELTPSLQEKIVIRNDDCNNQLVKLSKALKTGSYASLVLLDPFGMQIKWESIKKLGKTRSDVWILLPSGVAINRLLDKKMNLKSIEKLEQFFGITEDEIKRLFYQKDVQTSLFGEDEIIRKISDPINKIAEIYIKQLLTIWEYVTPAPLILTNSKNCPIFHFIFASNNRNAIKIASDIIKSK